MAQKIQIKRGLKQDLKILDVGELAYCIDTNQLYIGAVNGNVLILTAS